MFLLRGGGLLLLLPQSWCPRLSRQSLAADLLSPPISTSFARLLFYYLFPQIWDLLLFYCISGTSLETHKCSHPPVLGLLGVSSVSTFSLLQECLPPAWCEHFVAHIWDLTRTQSVASEQCEKVLAIPKPSGSNGSQHSRALPGSQWPHTIPPGGALVCQSLKEKPWV